MNELPKSYGRRYLVLDEFIEMCKFLGMDVNSNLLEVFERRGLLRPVYFVKFPLTYLEYLHKTNVYMVIQEPSRAESKIPDRWIKFEQVEDAIHRWPHPFTGISLFHPIDKSPERFRGTLFQSHDGGYRKWNRYKRTVGESLGHPATVDTRVPLYHYWQAYLVRDILDSWEVKILFDHRDKRDLMALMQRRVPRKRVQRLSFPSGILNSRGAFRIQEKTLDKLSFFTQAMRNLVSTQLVDAPLERALDPDLLLAYSTKRERYQKVIVKITQQRFGLDKSESINFLSFMSKRFYDQEDKGREPLRLMIREDIANMLDLSLEAFGVSFPELQKAVGRVGPPLKDSLEDIFPDKRKESTEVARRFLEGLLKKGSAGPFEYELSLAEIDEFLAYSEAAGLERLPWLLNLITEEWFSGSVFSRSALAVYLGDLSLIIEAYIKAVNRGSRESMATSGINEPGNLKEALRSLFSKEPWWSQFSEYYEVTHVSGTTNVEQSIRTGFINREFSTDQNRNAILRMLLVAVFTRNIASHEPGKLVEVDRNTYHYALDNVCFSLLFIWKFAKKNGLVRSKDQVVSLDKQAIATKQE